jgi:hypothetical protein
MERKRRTQRFDSEAGPGSNLLLAPDRHQPKPACVVVAQTLSIAEDNHNMIVWSGSCIWVAHNQLPGHPQMNQPHLAIIQTHLKILTATPNLTNRAAGQGCGEV